MNILLIIAELQKEREKVSSAILALERMVEADSSVGVLIPRRRGRPPGSKNRMKDSHERYLAPEASAAV